MTLAEELEQIEKDERTRRLREAPHILHPAGGLTETFVYEPIAVGKYAYRTADGKKGIAELKVEFEDPEKQRRPHWFLEIQGEQHYFCRKPPREWLFDMPLQGLVEKWVADEKQSFTTEEIWKINNVYLRIFLDFPHEYEFSIALLFIQQSWLTEILPVVFYLGIKGEFGGGKTVTAEAITLVCRHGYLTGNLSPPFVARAIQDQKITLMVDELDSLAGTKDSDLNSIFRQGYRRGMKYSRVNPETLEPQNYYIFGPKLFTVHSEIEEALQTRTVPIHVRETDKPEYPIINMDKQAIAKLIYTENFLWYLDNILAFRNNDLHTLNSLADQVDTVDIVDLKNWSVQAEEHTSTIRETLYKRKKSPLKVGQLSQLCQLAGRNVELMYQCFVLSNVVKVECDDDIVKTFQQKIVEEGERIELGYLGMLKEVLADLWKEKQGQSDYTTGDGFVKISNKEIYDKYNQKLKNEYGQGVSPAKFKEFLLEFGFTDALNRTKLKVPIPEDSAPKSRLCNIFTNRVLRKLGIGQQKKGLFRLVDLKNVFWSNQFPAEHECVVCGYSKLSAWKAETFTGEHVCEDCARQWEKQREVK